ISCRFPGVKLDGFFGISFASYWQDALEGALKVDGIMLEIPPPQLSASQTGLLKGCVAICIREITRIEAQGSLDESHKKALISLQMGFKDSFERLLAGFTPRLFPDGDSIVGVLFATDVLRGLLVIERQLARLGVLAEARIGHCDAKTGGIYSHHPKDTIIDFSQHLGLVSKLAEAHQSKGPPR
ncbi:MAG TPA: hypothetical protein VGR14_03350, partial [Verrucomicrobiae bacterium]|nr:hypothetical protein [Verrucomicrobiae bacterium]